MNEDENIVEKLMEKADRMLDRLTEALTDEDDDALAKIGVICEFSKKNGYYFKFSWKKGTTILDFY